MSERNCIEIVNKLIEMGMINLIHSMDGKEYITNKQIEKEIYDELYIHEGTLFLINISIFKIEFMCLYK